MSREKSDGMENIVRQTAHGIVADIIDVALKTDAVRTLIREQSIASAVFDEMRLIAEEHRGEATL